MEKYNLEHDQWLNHKNSYENQQAKIKEYDLAWSGIIAINIINNPWRHSGILSDFSSRSVSSRLVLVKLF